MRVIIYVEGPSDKNAMEALLVNLIDQKSEEGVSIEFFPIKGENNDRGGDAKKELLLNAPIKAVNILCRTPNSIVILLPDLYPKNKGFPHETFQQLKAGIMENFYQALQKKGIQDERLKERFKVFCFKYEMEALILAAESALRGKLGVTSLAVTWTIPVEDQNHDRPPSKIVDQLFRDSGKKYDKRVDPQLILGKTWYQEIAEKCPQCFKPFVEFIEGIQTENF
ncbi:MULTISPECIES: DUF4276 family protein [unclassified Microcoleus]|uniref:DUF4276 family protein n=1 Tax=unclassified Microcoleus TaxID=2642155 RepID=UPI002FD5957E